MPTLPHLPQLLVSVRDAVEAEAAVTGGASWIDVKQPLNGPLGMATYEAMAEVVHAVGGRRPVSVALGELHEWDPSPGKAIELPLGVTRAKIGLSRCDEISSWAEKWARFAETLPNSVAMVAVQYADWQSCGAPSPAELLDASARIGCKNFLIDTFDKQGGTLLDHFDLPMLESLFSTAASQGMLSVAAGSLIPDSFHQVCRSGADVIAVRGAACEEGHRANSVTKRRVQQLQQRLRIDFIKNS